MGEMLVLPPNSRLETGAGKRRGGRLRVLEEFLDCAPEALRELEDIPAHHPADWDGVPMWASRVRWMATSMNS
jgi:hypothetical protein